MTRHKIESSYSAARGTKVMKKMGISTLIFSLNEDVCLSKWRNISEFLQSLCILYLTKWYHSA